MVANETRPASLLTTEAQTGRGMSRATKITPIESARQARRDDVLDGLSVAALRARMVAGEGEIWDDAADVLDAILLALSGDHVAQTSVAKMAERARTNDRSRQKDVDLEFRRGLVAALQAWDGSNPAVETVAAWLSDSANNLALSLGATGKPGESYLREAVIERVAAALGRVLPGCHGKPDQGETLVRAGLRALGVDEKVARSKIDFGRRDRGE